MAKISRAIGSTSVILEVFILDSTSTVGAGKTGLAFGDSGFKAYYKRNKATGSTAITLATISTLGTWETGGFKVVDGTNMPGVYEFHPPDAAFASGADSVAFMLSGVTGMVPVLIEIELTATSNQDGVRGGMTALPNAAAAASGGLPTVDTTNSVAIQSSIKKNTARAGFTFPLLDTAGAAVTSASVTATRSIDGATFGACANAVSELANGWYKVDLAAGDVNGNVIALRFAATGAQDTRITLFTQP